MKQKSVLIKLEKVLYAILFAALMAVVAGCAPVSGSLNGSAGPKPDYESLDKKVAIFKKDNPEKPETFMLEISGNGKLEFENNESPWFDIKEKITKVTIGEGITYIGNSALCGTAITEITLPDSLTKIGENAFKDCAALAEVKNTGNIKYIYEGAFTGTKLKEFQLSNNFLCNSNNFQSDSKKLTFIDEPTIEGQNGFPMEYSKTQLFPENCKVYWRLDLDNQFYAKKIFIENIEKPYSFDVEIYGEGNLGKDDGSINFPSSFMINKLIITEGCKLIHLLYFNGHIEENDLISVELPASLEIIESGAFSSCPNLETVTIKEGSKLIEIGKTVFYNSPITLITLPDGCNYVKDDSWSSFNSQTEVTGGKAITAKEYEDRTNKN